MSVLKPRNRLINFRLTEEEFIHLRDACAAQGARSLSDFARSAVMRQASGNGPSEAEWVPQSLKNLDGIVASLESRVSQLLRFLDGVNGAPVEQPVEHRS